MSTAETDARGPCLVLSFFFLIYQHDGGVPGVHGMHPTRSTVRWILCDNAMAFLFFSFTILSLS
jgi:hypothetical protein